MNRLVPVLILCALLGACAAPRAAGPAHVELPSAPPEGEPVGTTGLHEAELKAQYGQPAFVRHDGNAQIWRFDGAACKAFFFLYSRGGDTAVWHVETAPRGQSIAADETCLSGLRARVAPQPVS
ncbi:MAG: hypothetical protein WDM86_10615 [Rhizomicrobium sp.]